MARKKRVEANQQLIIINDDSHVEWHVDGKCSLINKEIIHQLQ